MTDQRSTPTPTPEASGDATPPPDSGDAEVVELPLEDAGDLYRLFSPAVLGYIRAHRLPDPENVLGEVFYEVARDLDGFRGDRVALRRWVFATAHRKVAEAEGGPADREDLRADMVDSTPGLPASSGPDPDLVEALGRLTEDQREVLALRFVADLRLWEVADITGRSLSAVKELQARALRRLNRLLSSEALPSE
ncbi:MAG: sigma-70 family RNA polymerase sigma factor [Acidimicrobiales bacterium]